MAVVRCPRHDIPYNDQNPRGCPACARERKGEGDQTEVMRELARASRGVPAVEVLPPTEDTDDVEGEVLGWSGSVTQPPRLPLPEPTRLERLGRFLRENSLAAVAAGLGVLGLALLYVVSRPEFVEAYEPSRMSGDARPFPVDPNVPMVAVFAMLGSVTPQVNTEAPSLAHYDFGDGTVVDALNGVVYAVTLTGPVRMWRGNRVGLIEQTARGQLALLGTIKEQEPPPISPFPFGGFLTYRSRDQVPRRVLTTEVRPPNGCFDVRVDIAPQLIGTATKGQEAFVAAARRGDPLIWVTHRVRVVSRAVNGPWGTAVC